MVELLADNNEDDVPIVKTLCPECSDWLTMIYSARHGTKLQCGGCGEIILILIQIEAVVE